MCRSWVRREKEAQFELGDKAIIVCRRTEKGRGAADENNGRNIIENSIE